MDNPQIESYREHVSPGTLLALAMMYLHPQFGGQNPSQPVHCSQAPLGGLAGYPRLSVNSYTQPSRHDCLRWPAGIVSEMVSAQCAQGSPSGIPSAASIPTAKGTDSMQRTVGTLVLFALMSLTFAACAPRATVSTPSDSATSMGTSTTAGDANVKAIYLAGGCFWGLEKYVGLVQGVVSTEVGYANGNRDDAKYGDGSNYAEAVKVEYDPQVASLPFLLGLYYDAIEPTTVNRQGNDIGAEYRTGIYYTDPADKAVIEQSIAELQKGYSDRIAIEVGPLVRYNTAEDYHQKYLDQNPGGYCHIPRKLFEAAAAARPE